MNFIMPEENIKSVWTTDACSDSGLEILMKQPVFGKHLFPWWSSLHRIGKQFWTIVHVDFLLGDCVQWIEASTIQLDSMHQSAKLRFRLYEVVFCGNTVFWWVWVTVNKHTEVVRHWGYGSDCGKKRCLPSWSFSLGRAFHYMWKVLE